MKSLGTDSTCVGYVCRKLQNAEETSQTTLNKRRNAPCPWVRRLCIVKMSLVRRLISGFNAIASKVSAVFWIDVGELMLTSAWEGTEPRSMETTLQSNNEIVWWGARTQAHRPGDHRGATPLCPADF